MLCSRAMKITVKSYNAVAAWRWNTKIANTPTLTTAGHQKGTGGDQAMKEAAEAEEEEGEEEGDDDDEDVCGICQVPYEGCCPNCKIPGDDCPLSASRRPKDCFI